MEAYGGVEVQLYVFLTSTLNGDKVSAVRPVRFTPGVHWLGRWVGPRVGLGSVE
jgi:hypothetical protein